MRIALSLTATLVVPRFVAAQGIPTKGTQQRQWNEYTYANDGFAITLPYRADPHEDSTLSKSTFTAFTVSSTNAYSVRLPQDLALTLHVVTFPNGCSDFFDQYRSAIRRAKDGVLDASKAGIQADPSTLNDATAGGYPVEENEHEMKSKSRYYDRFQCVDRRLYISTAYWPAGFTKPPELDRIIKSFRLLTK